jgi:hypothetical protein
MAAKHTLRRYHLVLPEPLFDQIQKVAKVKQTTVLEVMKRFIKIGLLAEQVANKPGSSFVIKEGENERHILFV